MFGFIQFYLIVLLEAVCCIIFYEAFCEWKEELVQNSKILNNMLFILDVMLLSFALWLPEVFLKEFFIVKQCVIIVATSLIMLFFINSSLIKTLVLAVLFHSMLLIMDFITAIVVPLILEQINLVNKVGDFFIILISKSVLLIIVLFIRKFFQIKDMEYLKEKEWIKFLFFSLFSLGTIIVLVSNTSAVYNQQLEKVLWGFAFGLVCMNIFMFYFIQDIAKRERLLSEKNIFELETQNKRQLYESVLDNVKRQRELSHEYKNHVTCMQALCSKGQYDALEKYLEQLNGQVLHDLDYIDTNHAFINAVLNVKYQETVEKKILMIWKINDLSKITMAESDIVLVLSNLLNNAIEACDKYLGEKVIKLKLIYEDESLVLSVKNTFTGELEYKGGIFYTTKNMDKESHGNGIKNVIKVIEKYNGYYVFDYTENEFFVSVIIPQS